MLKLLVAVLAAGSLVAVSGSEATAAKSYRVAVIESPEPARLIAPQIVAGLRRAMRDFDVEARVVIHPIRTSYSSTIESLARSGYDLVIGLFEVTAAIVAVAPSTPDTRYAVDEASTGQPKISWPDNVGGFSERQEEIGFVVGHLAALVERERPGPDVIGSVGGFPVPAVDRLIAGYRAGAREASPGIRLLNGYSGDFSDPENCRRVAAAQIGKGARVIFNVAGACGLGTLAAARAAGVWAIGVDQDQSSLGEHVLTSAVKRYDVVTYRLIELLVQGRFVTGRETLLGLREGVLELGRISPRISRSLVERTREIEHRIETGRISGIPTTVR